MRTLLFCLLALLPVIPTPASAMPICGGSRRITCVVDGDTFWFQGEKIRIENIDAPEVSSPRCRQEKRLGDDATDYLHALLNRGDIQIKRTGTDRYGRTLALVSVDGRDVGKALIAAGLAHRWGGGKRSWCN